MNTQLHVRRGLLVTAGMIFCLAFGVYGERWRARYEYDKHAADSYQFFDTLVDIRSQILRNYVEPVDEQKLLNGAVQGMMAQLDPYSNYFSKDELSSFDRMTHGQFSGIGAEMSQDPTTGAFIVVSPLEDSPALKAGMYAGDRILKINGESVADESLKELTTKVSGPTDSTVTVTVLHEGDKTPVDLSIKRAVVTVQSVKGFQHDPGGSGQWDYLIDPAHRIAYVRINNFMENTADELDHALLPLINSKEGLKGIILDLRFDPGGLLDAAIGVSNRFIDSGVIVSTRGRDARNEFVAQAKKEGVYPRIPLVVLMNEYSASASEIVAGALKDHGRAVLIGTRTFGKGSVQSLITLEGGQSALKLTTAYYYLPSGKNIMRKKGATSWGVDPDLAVPLTEAENRDVLRARMDSEVIRHAHAAAATTTPVAGANTDLTAPPPATQSTTEAEAPFTDRQLQRALDVLLAYPKLNGEIAVEVPTTRPNVTASVATVPAETQPALQSPTTTNVAPPPVPETAPTTGPGASEVQPNAAPNTAPTNNPPPQNKE